MKRYQQYPFLMDTITTDKSIHSNSDLKIIKVKLKIFKYKTIPHQKNYFTKILKWFHFKMRFVSMFRMDTICYEMAL